jgi:pyruvate/2-oxoglutarate dehydrogenase complex dihydrolipoamide dehydrogenase (E3) component
MPLDNGKKVLELLESGQLRAVKGSKAFWDEDRQRLVLEQKDDKGRSVEGHTLIESLGQEFNTSKLNSPLLQTLLRSGLLESHPVSGIDVDFNTFKTASGIYAIGSLTKGVRFYVVAADRVTVHASRIADSLIHLAPRKSPHIAFFVGSDLFSNLMFSNSSRNFLHWVTVPSSSCQRTLVTPGRQAQSVDLMI